MAVIPLVEVKVVQEFPVPGGFILRGSVLRLRNPSALSLVNRGLAEYKEKPKPKPKAKADGLDFDPDSGTGSKSSND